MLSFVLLQYIIHAHSRRCLHGSAVVNVLIVLRLFWTMAEAAWIMM